MFFLADDANLGNAAAAELPGFGAGEMKQEDTREGIVSFVDVLRRPTDTVSPPSLRRILKTLSLCESTWHGPS